MSENVLLIKLLKNTFATHGSTVFLFFCLSITVFICKCFYFLVDPLFLCFANFSIWFFFLRLTLDSSNSFRSEPFCSRFYAKLCSLPWRRRYTRCQYDDFQHFKVLLHGSCIPSCILHGMGVASPKSCLRINRAYHINYWLILQHSGLDS